MAVQDLWHSSKGARTRCPDCRSLQGPATARHGTGKRWRVIVPGHPSRAFTVKADAQQWERELWQQPTGGPSGQHVEDLIALWLDGKRHVTPAAFRQYRDAATRATARFPKFFRQKCCAIIQGGCMIFIYKDEPERTR